MKPFESYYNEAVRFLKTAGAEYAAAHPDTAHCLDFKNMAEVFPGIEELLGGCGFLGARILHYLDQTRTDFYGDLVNLFWPHLARDIPSITMLQFNPYIYEPHDVVTVKRGSNFNTNQTGPDSIPCTFTTTQDVRIAPMALRAVEKRGHEYNASELALYFSVGNGVKLKDLGINPLRLHLAGEQRISVYLHELFTCHAKTVRIRCCNKSGIEIKGRDAITPGGMGPDETLLPPDPRTNWAATLLAEYFVFREKFLCFDLHGICPEQLPGVDEITDEIVVTVSLDRALSPEIPFTADNFKLFCTPAVNICRQTLEPVTAALTRTEYPLCADQKTPISVIPHSIISVAGCNRKTLRTTPFDEVTSFKAAQTGAPTWLARHEWCEGKEDRCIRLLIGGGGQLSGFNAEGENLSILALCTNGDLPHATLTEGSIGKCETGLPDGISFTNITHPTPRHLPADDPALDLLVTCLAAHYKELKTAESLTMFLKAHDRIRSPGTDRRTGCIRNVVTGSAIATDDRTPMQGTACTITVDEAAFSDLNDLHLWAQIVSGFLALWSRLDNYLEIRIAGKPSGRELRFSSLDPWIRAAEGRSPSPLCAGDNAPEGVLTSTPERPVSSPAAPQHASIKDTGSMMDTIIREARTLNYFGLMRLLEGYFSAKGVADPFKSGRVFLLPDDSISFPSSDIVSITRHEDRFVVKLAFMGLPGVSSPLPPHWSEAIVRNPENSRALYAFLTIFNKRLYELFYEAYKKYRLDPLPGEYSRDPLVRCIAALGGIAPGKKFFAGDLSILNCLPIFATSPRSATGLASIISLYLGNIPVTVKRFMPHVDAIPPEQQTRLGGMNCSLGVNAMVGSTIENCAGKFRVILGPLSRSMFEDLFSGGFQGGELKELIESYVASTMDYDVELLIRYRELPPAGLGMGSRLGINTLLGTHPDPQKTSSVIIKGRKTDGLKYGDSHDTILSGNPVSSGRTLDKYFEEDVRSLYESAHLFAKSFPQVGKELSISSGGTSDPVVERLFQGVAFQSARLREILDDTLPELSERLFQRQWPEFLHALPSATIIEFAPMKGSLSQTHVLRRGTELLSKNIKASGGERIVFSTSYDVTLNPVALETVRKSTDAKGRGCIDFTFSIENGVSWSAINLDPLRLYIHGEDAVALAIHRMFLHETEKVSIRYDEGGPGKEIVMDDPKEQAIRFPFCDPEYRLLHGHPYNTPGYASIIEYNAFRQKFLFVDLHGFHNERFAKAQPAPRCCTVTVIFKTDFPRDIFIAKEHFRLFCSPAVNLFKRSAELLPTGIVRNDFTVAAVADAPKTHVPHSVIAVSAKAETGVETHGYLQKHNPAAFGLQRRGTWESHLRQDYDGRLSIRVRLDHGTGATGDHRSSPVTTTAFFSNGSIPHTDISIGDIAFHATGFNTRINFANLTVPTLPTQPPRGENQWRFIALSGSRPTVPLSTALLGQFLNLLDWSGGANKKRIGDAIADFSASIAKWVRGGELVRGMEYTLTLNGSALHHENDLHLFGQALGEFLRSKTSVASFLSLVIITRPSGTMLKWEHLAGTAP